MKQKKGKQMIKEMVLTEEQKAKLKQFMPINPKKQFDYIPAIFRELGEDVIKRSEWPVFTLSSRDGVDIAKFEDNFGYMDTATNHFQTTAGKFRLKVLASHIASWKNYKTEAGEEIKFTTDATGLVSESALAFIPVALQRELLVTINDSGTLNDEELLGLK